MSTLQVVLGGFGARRTPDADNNTVDRECQIRLLPIHLRGGEDPSDRVTMLDVCYI